MNFPNNPTIGQTWTIGAKTFVYSGNNKWDLQSISETQIQRAEAALAAIQALVNYIDENGPVRTIAGRTGHVLLTADDTHPVGSVLQAYQRPSDDWVACDGSTYLGTEYPDALAVMGSMPSFNLGPERAFSATGQTQISDAQTDGQRFAWGYVQSSRAHFAIANADLTSINRIDTGQAVATSNVFVRPCFAGDFVVLTYRGGSGTPYTYKGEIYSLAGVKMGEITGLPSGQIITLGYDQATKSVFLRSASALHRVGLDGYTSGNLAAEAVTAPPTTSSSIFVANGRLFEASYSSGTATVSVSADGGTTWQTAYSGAGLGGTTIEWVYRDGWHYVFSTNASDGGYLLSRDGGDSFEYVTTNPGDTLRNIGGAMAIFNGSGSEGGIVRLVLKEGIYTLTLHTVGTSLSTRGAGLIAVGTHDVRVVTETTAPGGEIKVPYIERVIPGPASWVRLSK